MLYLFIGIEHFKLQSGFIDTLYIYIYIYIYISSTCLHVYMYTFKHKNHNHNNQVCKTFSNWGSQSIKTCSEGLFKLFHDIPIVENTDF